MCYPRPGTSPQNRFQAALGQKKIPQPPWIKAYHRKWPGSPRSAVCFSAPLLLSWSFLVYFARLCVLSGPLGDPETMVVAQGAVSIEHTLAQSQDASGSSEILCGEKHDPVGSQCPKNPPVDTQSTKRCLLGAVKPPN